MRGIVLDRGADPGDVDVDAAVERLQRLPAHQLHQPLAREHAPGVLGQRPEQLELVAGERARLAAQLEAARVAVDLEAPEAQARARARARRAGAGSRAGAPAARAG